MEGQRRQAQLGQEQDNRGRAAESPVQIPKLGWRDILLRAKDGVSAHNISIVAAGAAFFLLLGLIPALASLISIYGLVAAPSVIQAQFASIASMMPAEARMLLEGQMKSIASQPHTAGFAVVVSIVLALWGGSTGVKTLMNALNIAYSEEEKRGYIKLSLIALGLTLAFVVVGAVSIGLIVALPPVLAGMGLGSTGKLVGSIARWPFLLVVALIGLAVLYRYGPSRETPKWRWVSPGALTATILWVAGSFLFSFYAGHFGNYNKTYGSLGGAVVLMMWLYVSAFVVLLGAEINAEIEHQTAKDSTTGPPRPLGRRGAYVADMLGEKRSEKW